MQHRHPVSEAVICPVALGTAEETLMADYIQKRGPPDAMEIDLADDGEVDDMRGWCEHFACTPEQLRAAVGKVGPVRKDVHALLTRMGWTSRPLC
jgi:uncharacterized protein DUF3606